MSTCFSRSRVTCPPIMGFVALLLTLPWAYEAQGAEQRPGPPRKPATTDTVRANVYADNTFSLHVNGELVAVDSIAFIPHNVISVDILPAYPMTIAEIAKDNADPKTGMEYANTNIGDAGFITLLATIATAADRGSRPNIVFMLADDQGWSGLSVAMHPDVRVAGRDLPHAES